MVAVHEAGFLKKQNAATLATSAGRAIRPRGEACEHVNIERLPDFVGREFFRAAPPQAVARVGGQQLLRQCQPEVLRGSGNKPSLGSVHIK